MRALQRNCLFAIVAAVLTSCQGAPDTRRSVPPDDGLDKSAEEYIGKLVEVQPFNGYGWNESHLLGRTYSHNDIAPPPPFNVRVKRLWSYEGTVRRGGVGQVESPGHQLDRLWLIFSTRHEGHFDFTNRIGDYNVDLMSAEPTDSNETGWPVVPKNAPAKTGYSGYARIVQAPR